MLTQLAQVAATRLENALLYEREHRVAETLQRSLLPETVPRLDGAELAALYLPGSSEASVGGDWYDAIVLDDGSVALVIGDVVGRGVKAASSMGQLRNAVRAYLLEGYGPAQTLARVNRLLDSLGGGFATLACLVVDPLSGAIRYANAGHPPPLVVGPDGATRWLEDGLAPPIGAAQGVAYRAGRGPDPRRRRARPLHRRPGRAPPRADRHRPRPARRGRGGRAGPCRRRWPTAWSPRCPTARGPTTSPCWCSRAMRGRRRAARRAPARRPDLARPAARAAAALARRPGARRRRGRRRAAGGRGGRLQRDRAPARAGARRLRRHTDAAWRGTPCGSRSATTAAGTSSRRRRTAGAACRSCRRSPGSVAVERTPARDHRDHPPPEGGPRRMSHELEFDTDRLPEALIARPLGDVDMAVTPGLQADAARRRRAPLRPLPGRRPRVGDLHRQLGDRAPVPPARRRSAGDGVELIVVAPDGSNAARLLGLVAMADIGEVRRSLDAALDRCGERGAG